MIGKNKVKFKNLIFYLTTLTELKRENMCVSDDF